MAKKPIQLSNGKAWATQTAALAQRFRDFHCGAALLRVISAERNLTIASSQRGPEVRQPVALP